MSDIFISYKREDQPEARKLADALEREGWSVWWDPKLRAGEHFDDVIEIALKESKCVVVMWSRLSVNSRYVKDEATYAINRCKLVPVAIEEVELPFRFEGLHTPSLIDWDGSDDFSEFKKFVEDITAIIGDPTDQPNKRQTPRKRRRASAQPPDEIDIRKPGTIFCDILKDGSNGPEMIVIPAGNFQMGDIHEIGANYEKPVHTVQIRNPFALGRYQVTFDEYDKCAKLTRRELLNDRGWGRGRRPVINITWDEAVKYTKWLSAQTGKRYRLPTEAEWEYAARSGGKEEKWPGTSRGQEVRDFAWYDKNSGRKTQQVGRKKSNGWGLYDMSGNVFEWVEDCWHENYNGAPEDESAWLRAGGGNCGWRVVRGGCFGNGPELLRSSFRFRSDADDRGSVGFRLAGDLK
jgi:formylglycine-generating enzyme required for sulfatase activity